MELKIENIVETIVKEVVKELSKKGYRITLADEENSHSCSCEIKEINPCRKTSELSKKYLINIKTELNDCMAL